MISLILLGFLPLSVYQQNMDFFMELHIVACVHSEFHLLFVEYDKRLLCTGRV